MATTDIAALWTPDVWVKGVDEQARILPAFISSGAVTRSAVLDEIASGGGKIANLPFFKDITDQMDAIQVEGTAPTPNAIGGGKNVAPILNRVGSWDVTALSAGVSGEDPVGAILQQLAIRRQKQSQTVALAIARGLLGSAGAAGGGAAVLKANLLDIFIEDGATAAATNKISAATINGAIALLGELSGPLQGGAILIHPAVHAALKTIDSAGFTVEKVSGQPFYIQLYQGIPVYLSSLLVRAGTTSGSVYESYFFGPGVFGWGEKSQLGDEIGVASMQMYERKDVNNWTLYDRRRYLIHVNGTAFIGTPAGQSATNTELSTVANWSLVYSSADRVPIACLRSN
jgi:hypothetical protein